MKINKAARLRARLRAQSRRKRRTPTAEGLSALCLQLYELYRAGVPVDECMEILRDDAPDEQERAMFSAILRGLDEGLSLSRSMHRSGYIPAYMANMVSVGEQTGTLEEVFAALADYYDREHYVDVSVKNAVFYPGLMAVMMVVILGILTAFVLPVFADVFAQLGLSLSPAATVLMRMGQALASVSGGVLAVLVAGATVMWSMWRQGKLSFTKKTALSRQIAAGRFASAMALMLHSGFALDEALELAGRLAAHPAALEASGRARAGLEQGRPLSEGLAAGGLFTGHALRMLRVGERAGRTAEMMDQVASRLTAETGAAIDDRIARVEPALVALLAGAAGLILLSVMLPLLGVLSAIG